MANPAKINKSFSAVEKTKENTKFSTGVIELSIIIVNYNVKDFLEQTLISVKKALKGILSEIIVVDNASSDGSTVLMRQKYPDVTLVDNSENLGFAKGSNQGLRLARGKYLVLLNPDTIVQEGTFKKMLMFYKKHPDTGMVGCKILNPDGTLQLACRRSFPTPWVAFTKLSGLSYLFPKSRLFGKYNLTYLDPDRSCEVDAISGSFMMLHRKILKDVGYLDEAFFLYGEDLDWCYRIRENGWKVQYSPETAIIHFKGESSKRAQFDHLKVFYRAMSLFAQKHFKHKYLVMPYWLLWIAIWLRAGFSFILKSFNILAVPLIDIIFLSFSLVLSIYFRFGSLVKVSYFLPVILACIAIWMGVLYYFGCYHKDKYSFSKSSFAIIVGFLLNTSLFFFFQQYAYSRFVVLLGGFFSLITIPGWRFFIKILPRIGFMSYRGTFGKTLLARNTLIVGDIASSEKLIKKFRAQIDAGYNISGLVSINGSHRGDLFDGVEVIGSINELNALIKERKIQEVIFSTDRLTYDRILGVISKISSQRVNFKLVPSNLDVIIGKASIDRIEDVPLLDIDYKLHQSHYRIIKRTFDIILAFSLFILSLPIFLYKRYLTAAGILTKSIFGNQNKAIILYEFSGNGSRLLNNIPYLWSILKGELSFVGTEMVSMEISSEPKQQISYELKPGITGLMQINRHENLNHADKEKYNLYYLNNYSPLLDLEILFKALFKI